ncbi:MAG: acetate/propionate family kinase [Verrucomicrobiae bacterium]|nr:acetate/propionate family kinase [Verrucomicrobiae bacterium]
MSASSKTKILVANIGSTSFKYNLFEMRDGSILAKGGSEKIGAAEGLFNYKRTSDGRGTEGKEPIPDYGRAIELAFQSLMDPAVGVLSNMDEVAAIGFKVVMARGVTGTVELTEPVLRAMEEYYTLLPAHNPPYVNAVRFFRNQFPAIPCIGTFETAFYTQVPEENTRFAIPREWHEKYGIRRNGFHGASHRFVTEEAARIIGRPDLRIISCHLGGSSSIAAVRNGVAVDSSWGMTPQSGLPQNNRVGDFDAFALIYLIRDLGLGVDKVEQMLMKESGLKGLAGTATGDLRDILESAHAGNADAKLALNVFVKNIRNYIGQFLVELGGVDAIVFTAGISENNPWLREMICARLDSLGIAIDPALNGACPKSGGTISPASSRVRVMVIPTSEETIIARNAWALLHSQS